MKTTDRTTCCPARGGRAPAGRASGGAARRVTWMRRSITLDDAANTTDVYAFVHEENGRKVARHRARRLPVRGARHRARTNTTSTTTCSTRSTWPPATTWQRGARRFRYQFRFDTQFKNTKTILQSYLGVVHDVDDAAQNLTQFYTVTKVNNRHGQSHACSAAASCRPTTRGSRRRSTTRTTTARTRPEDGVADARRARSLHRASRSRRCPAATSPLRASATTASTPTFRRSSICCSCAVPGKDSQGGFNLHLMALAIPIDRARRRPAGRRRLRDHEPAAVHDPGRRPHETAGLRRLGAGGPPGQSAVQRGPRRDRGQGPVQPHAARRADKALFRKYAENPELAKLLNLLVFEPDLPAIETGRTDIASASSSPI